MIINYKKAGKINYICEIIIMPILVINLNCLTLVLLLLREAKLGSLALISQLSLTCE